MKRKTVTALLMGLCLTVSVPGTAYGAAEPVVGVTEKSDSISAEGYPGPLAFNASGISDPG